MLSTIDVTRNFMQGAPGAIFFRTQPEKCLQIRRLFAVA
jgi:hypothetical protein